MLSTLRDVTALLGLTIARFEGTRATDADSVGNGNWLGWTKAGECLVLRRYHVLHSDTDLAYESEVLRQLAVKGWTVPEVVAGPVR